LLHLYGSIRAGLGPDVAAGVKAHIDTFKKERICVVRCRPTAVPAYLRGPRGIEEFYVRAGPSSVALERDARERHLARRLERRQLSGRGA
jgi:hypothetical protein